MYNAHMLKNHKTGSSYSRFLDELEAQLISFSIAAMHHYKPLPALRMTSISNVAIRCLANGHKLQREIKCGGCAYCYNCKNGKRSVTDYGCALCYVHLHKKCYAAWHSNVSPPAKTRKVRVPTVHSIEKKASLRPRLATEGELAEWEKIRAKAASERDKKVAERKARLAAKAEKDAAKAAKAE